MFTGRQALGLKLIDGLGSEQDAIAWLEQEKGVAKNLPVRDWQKRPDLGRLGLLGFASQAAVLLGLDSLSAVFQRAEAVGDLKFVDGLMSIWHSGAAN